MVKLRVWSRFPGAADGPSIDRADLRPTGRTDPDRPPDRSVKRSRTVNPGMTGEERPGSARYVFRVRFRLDPGEGVYVDPASFETTLSREADPPGEEGWQFFRDNCWRGDLADPEHFRELTGERLGVPVESVAFSELRTDPAYLDALRSAIGDDLAAFNADSVDEVLKKYLGSSIHVED